jgi:hypothetical protein
MVKTVFIAHPILGSVEDTLEQIFEIYRSIPEKILPVWYSTWRVYLPVNELTKELYYLSERECFRRGKIEELWLYSSEISEVMEPLIKLARECDVVIVGQTEKMKEVLRNSF